MNQIRFGIAADALSRERVKRAVHIIEEKCESEDVEIDTFDLGRLDHVSMISTLQNDLVDVVAVDGSEIEELKNNDLVGDQIDIACYLKRGDPRSVLLINKRGNINIQGKYKNSLEKLTVLVDDTTRQIQLKRLFDDITCINTTISAENLIEQVKSGTCDGALVWADELKLLHKGKEKEIAYHYIENEYMVPDTGRAVICLLAKKGTNTFDILKRLSNIKSEKEYMIESIIRKRLEHEHSIPIDYLCVLAAIERSRLSIYIDLGLKRRSFRMKEHGEYEHRSLLIRRIIEKIENIVDY